MAHNIFELRTDSPEETERVGQLCGQLVHPGDVIALVGPLGAGKTKFVQGLARGLGFEGYVRSPSFTLVHEYRGRALLYHIDAFRLTGSQELADIGPGDYIGEHAVTAIEWADRVDDSLPPSHLRVELSMDPEEETVRRLRFVPFGSRFACLVEELRRLCGC